MDNQTHSTAVAPGLMPAGYESEQSLARAGLIAAAGLFAFGVILWIAANWTDLGKAGRFALVGAVLLAAAIASATSSRLRVPAAVIGIAAIGGLFALVGQTYQTGADPWQLFALWSLLALPWALAARHDAVWFLWVLATYPAFPLWLNANSPWWTFQPDTVLPAWMLAAIPALLLSPGARLQARIGSTRWSFRLATVSFLILLVSCTVPSIFNAAGDNTVGSIGILVTVAVVAALAFTEPFDLSLLAIAALGLDIELITLLTRATMTGSRVDSTASMFVIGLGSAAIVAASGTALLKLAQHRGLALTRSDGALWPLIVLTSIGALITAIPLIAALTLLFGVLLSKGAGAYIVGVALAGGGGGAVATSRPLGFVHQLGIIVTVTGLILLGYGFYRDLPDSLASLAMLAIVTGLAIVVPARWMAAVLGAFAAVFFITTILALLPEGSRWWRLSRWLFELSCLVTCAVAAAAIVLIPRLGAVLGQVSSELSERASRFVAGWSALALITAAVTSGPTFLFGGPTGQRRGIAPPVPELTLDLSLTPARTISLALAVAAMLWIWRNTTVLSSASAKAIAAVVSILSYVISALGGPLAILASAYVERRRVLAVLSAIALLWIMGSFYYWLGWPLAAKGYFLMLLGVGLGGFLVARAGLEAKLPAKSAPAQATPIVAAALIGLSLFATAAIAAHDVRGKERLIATGRKVYVALAPVDPRSLMQGDYMALRFALPTVTYAERKNPPRWVSAEIDARGLASKLTFVAAALPPGTDRITMFVGYANGQPLLATNAYFFKEGTAKRYEAARFGEFRVGVDGTVLLVGLADKYMQRID